MGKESIVMNKVKSQNDKLAQTYNPKDLRERMEESIKKDIERKKLAA